MTTTALRHLTQEQIASCRRDGYLAVPGVIDPPYGLIVRGEPAKITRLETGRFRMPPDWREGYTSIYELQSRSDAR